MATQPNQEVAVVINFLQGSFQSGFKVSLDILSAGVRVHQSDIPDLPPAPSLRNLYELWRSRYIDLSSRTITPIPNQLTHSQWVDQESAKN